MNVIRKILEKAHTIAIVGLSSNEEKPSHIVGKYLKEQGYLIIPVNDHYETLLGQKSYPNLSSIPSPVDVVDIFRRPEAIPPIIDEAISIGVKWIWMQEGIVDQVAAEKARAAGINVVMDRCIRKEHIKFKNSQS